MGRQLLDPWLVPFLWCEIQAVTSWRRSIDHGIKPELDSRFSDDGSNFRNLISAPPPGQELVVQLYKVLSVKDDVTVILSDGTTQIRTRLSGAAVANLAAETCDNTFGFDVTGDIIQLKRFTIISTPFGPSEGFVQLDVEEIEHDSLSRKLLGQPRPIEEHEDIRFLLDDIVRLRCPQDHSSQASEDGELGQSSSNLANATISSQHIHAREGLPDIAVSQSPMPTTASTLQGLQTQATSRARHLGPSLACDGFQIESGVNLHRPLQPGCPNMLRHNNVSRTTGNQTSTAQKLLGLFTKKRPREDESNELTTSVHGEVVIVSETPVNSASRAPPEPSSSSADKSSRVLLNDSIYDTAATPSGKTPACAQPLPKELEGSLLCSSKTVVHYGRRKIPSNQRGLLDRPESWLPSLPGHRFPTPNVPIELFNKWRKIRSATPSPQGSHQQNSNFEQLQAASSPVSSNDEQLPWSDSDGAAASDDSEPFSASQWPQTQPQQRSELPPDSSVDSVRCPTQHDDLEVDVPQALPIRRSRLRPPHAGHPLPLKPAAPPLAPLSSRPLTSSPRCSSFTGVQSQSGAVSSTVAASEQRTIERAGAGRRPVTPKQPKILQQKPAQRSVEEARQGANIASRSPHTAVEQRFDVIGSAPTSPQATRTAELPGSRHSSSPQTLPFHGAASPSLWPMQAESSPGNHSSQMQLSPTASEKRLETPFRNPPMVGRNLNARSSPFGSRERTVKTYKGAANEKAESNTRGHATENRYRAQAGECHASPTLLREQRRPSMGPATRSQCADQVSEKSHAQRQEHPDERHRRIRKNYLSRTKSRRDWLQENYHVDLHGTVRFQDMLRTYRTAHPGDGRVEAKDFGEAVSQAFPHIRERPLQMTFQPRLSRISSRQDSAPHNGPQLDGADNALSEAESQSKPLDTNGTGKARDSQETHVINETGDALMEFYRNWLGIKPGGHFAIESRGKQQPRRSVDVLKWDTH